MAWLEARVFGREDLEDEGDDELENDTRADNHPRALHVNRPYKLPVELWPKRALASALAMTRHTQSLPFFAHHTFDALKAETDRRASGK
jgi:hypothetical protein